MPEENDNEDAQQKEMKRELMKRYRAQQQEQQIRMYMQQILDARAYERLMNVRVSNRELYMQVAQLLVNAAQSNRSIRKINESQLIDLIDRITNRRDTKIEFKRK